MTVYGKRNVHKKPVPFGSTAQRFGHIGYHPKRETRPGTYNYWNIFPGCHDWNKPPKIVSKISSWKRCLETEEFSRRLAFHGDGIIARRKWQASINGPGWHNLRIVSSARDIKFLKSERFTGPKTTSSSVPGPGTYGKDHLPSKRKEEKSKEKGFSFSNVVPFQGAAARPKSLDPQPSYHLPPNLYNIKSSIEELITKRTSKRGPYDLFTGPRFQRVIIPKLGDKKQISAMKIDPNAWNHPKNAFKGKFMKCGKDSLVATRMVLKIPEAGLNALSNPGPGDYDPFPPAVIGTSHFPFNSSVKVARPALRRDLHPPPGRYNIHRKKRILGDGMRSVFMSKTPRGTPNVPKWSWFE